jgi:DNA-binding MarR family transcriptional regulator
VNPVPAKEADAVDRVVHEPARLSILSRLASADGGVAPFTELRDGLGLTAGNLSVQLRNLEEAGYVEISKTFRGQKPYTELRITAKGEEALGSYLSRMESLIASLKGRLGAQGGM